MSNIRETKTGLIAFGTSIITVITGLMFALIITRTLTPEEFGTWNVILSLVSYSLIIEPMISWWTTRDVARGEEIGKTAVITNGVSSIGGSFIFLVIAYLLTIKVLVFILKNFKILGIIFFHDFNEFINDLHNIFTFAIIKQELL